MTLGIGGRSVAKNTKEITLERAIKNVNMLQDQKVFNYFLVCVYFML